MPEGYNGLRGLEEEKAQKADLQQFLPRRPFERALAEMGSPLILAASSLDCPTHLTGTIRSDYLGWHICRAKFARKIILFELRIPLRKMLSNFPENFEPLF